MKFKRTAMVELTVMKPQNCMTRMVDIERELEKACELGGLPKACFPLATCYTLPPADADRVAAWLRERGAEEVSNDEG